MQQTIQDPPATAITVLLVDDHAAIRVGMRMVVESAEHFVVVGEAENGSSAISMARALRPDIVLMDLRMPVMDGVAATEQITGQGLAKVLVLTTFDHDDYLFGALRAGAQGFLLKTASPQSIIDAMHAVVNGDQVISPEVTRKLVSAALESQIPEPLVESQVDPREVLTERELQVLRQLGAGLSNYSIGRTLGIGETTVKTHVSRVLSKLGVNSRLQAALLAQGTFSEIES
ncbi:DNA-binding response regulator [Arthrobacter sp. MYb227]|uniref:response regulator n=1 Tax=Arthrobacter sp. MYb227 TaxID=1848601 RepID=UPI000CFB06D3|nr:response regulator transcription factor [Arthrobacter sp. MYb227]PQZ91647.1 DNA-binding response regulator [Arthrobacter sp. MYb227]